MTKCSKCQHESAPGARFCAECGTRLGLACPRCSAAVSTNQKFCSACGNALNAALTAGGELSNPPSSYTPAHLAQRILASRHALHGEKKQVTVLFCDIVGSTELAATLGAEDMHALLSAFLGTALAEVHRYEGTVNQFLGDGFMAIFGAPLAYEDHASRAARAALAIQRAVIVAHDDLPLVAGWDSLRLRMGLNSGQVVVGAIGDDLRMDYTASGDTTHLAARLEALAAPGEIICGEATLAAAKGVLVVDTLGTVLVKGIAQPVPHYRLRAIDDHSSWIRRNRSRFVGREHEIHILRTVFERVRNGQGGVVEIEGEPGVGKSRLIAEYSSGLDSATRVVRSHCVAYGRQAPNVPIIELVRGLCGIDGGDAEPAAKAAIVRALGGADSEEADLLGALLGQREAKAKTASLDPATARGRTTQAMVRLLARAGAAAPVVLMVEDLHWADASSLDFLAALADQCSSARCLMIVTFRPGSEPPWSAQLRLERLHLAPLSLADARALIRTLEGVSDLVERALVGVLTRAEGNPFFLEELVRAAAQGSDKVPGDVFDVLDARIDRLEPDVKDWLRIGAVIGREFSLDLVEEVAGFADRARPHIETLVTRGFVEPAAGSRRFMFVHALTQEVAYNGMLTEDRRRLHTAVAERMAARISVNDQDSESIARHHLQGLDPVAALPYLDTAIERAIRHHALEAAHEFFEDALRLLEAESATPENAARRIGLLLRQFPVFHFTHRHKEYAALIERYLPIVDALGMPVLRGPFLAQRGHRLWVASRYPEAIASLSEAASICAEVGDAASAAHAECMLAWTCGNSGDCDAALTHGQASLRWLEQCPVPLLQTFTYVALLLAHAYRGRWREALDAGERAREAGVAAKDDGLASFGGGFWSFAALASGDPVRAIALAERAVAEAPTDYFRGWAAAFMAAVMVRTGKVEQGLLILEQAVALAQASSHVSGFLLIAALLAEARLMAGKSEQARILLEQLRGEAEAYPYVSGLCVQLLAEISLADGESTAALEGFRAASAVFARIDAQDALCQTRFGEGRALAAIGDVRAARVAYTAALTGFELLGTLDAPDKVRAALQALEVLSRSG